jgi:WD40 repeat protein
MRPLCVATRACVVGLTILAAGCADSARLASVPALPLAHAEMPVTYMDADAKKAKNLLYASAFVGGTVEVYNQVGTNQSAIGQIGSIGAPSGLAVTPKGDLFVASQHDGTVSAFHKGATTPYTVLTGGTSLTGVTVAPDGTVYASNGSSNKIYKWASGSTTPTVLTPVFTEPCEYVATDAKGNLFVDSIFSEFDEFPAGSSTATKLFVSYIGTPSGILINAKGDLIANFTGGVIATFPPPYKSTPSAQFPYYGEMLAIALEKNGKTLWGGNMVPKGSGGTVAQAYAMGTGALLDSTSNIGSDSILGIATYPPSKT